MSSQGAPPPPPRVATPTNPETARLIGQLQGWAASTRQDEHLRLRDALAQPGKLDQLDAPGLRDRMRPIDLNLARVLERLRQDAPLPRATLGNLVQVPVLRDEQTRAGLLVRALGSPGELAPESLRFLQARGKVGSVDLELVVEALCRNASPPALDLLLKILQNSDHPLANRRDWIHLHLLGQRRSIPFLGRAEAWLTDPAFEPEIRSAIAETLFEYRPKDWFRTTEAIPKAPSDNALPDDVRTALRRIAQKIESGEFSTRIKAAAKRVSEGPLMAPRPEN